MLVINILYEESPINSLRKQIFPDNIFTFLSNWEASPTKTDIRIRQKKTIV